MIIITINKTIGTQNGNKVKCIKNTNEKKAIINRTFNLYSYKKLSVSLLALIRRRLHSYYIIEFYFIIYYL